MILVRSRRARNDLIAIWRYVAADNATAATELVKRIDGRCEALLDFPEMGVLHRGGRKDIRQLTEGDYLILYRATARRIEIVRVMHGRRDLGDW